MRVILLKTGENFIYSKGKAVPLPAEGGPESSRKLSFPDFMTKYRMVVRFSALSTGRLYPQEIFLLLISVGDRGGTVVKVLCHKSEDRWFDPSWWHWNFLLT